MSTRVDFEFMERIGRGASSVVFKARRKADGQIYCIKEIDLSVVTPEEEDGALQEVNRNPGLFATAILEHIQQRTAHFPGSGSYTAPSSRCRCTSSRPSITLT